MKYILEFLFGMLFFGTLALAIQITVRYALIMAK